MGEERERERDNLMQKLLDSVKQCQVSFGGKTTLATDKDSSVLCLINQLEHSLQHGLKRNKILEKINALSEPLRQVTQKMLPEIEITFWSPVKEFLGPLDIQHYNTLEGISSDSGRARVWLRIAINESTLERHLNTMLAGTSLLSQFYEPWALLLDEEKSSTIPIMAQGLSSILFAIDTKAPDLNQPFKNITQPSTTKSFKTHRRINSTPLPIMAGFDTEPSILKKINVKKKKKKKAVNATISDLEEIPSSTYSTSYGDNNFANNYQAYSLSHGDKKRFTAHESIDYPQLDISDDTESDQMIKSVKSAPVSPVFNTFNDTGSLHNSNSSFNDYSARNVNNDISKHSLVNNDSSPTSLDTHNLQVEKDSLTEALYSVKSELNKKCDDDKINRKTKTNISSDNNVSKCTNTVSNTTKDKAEKILTGDSISDNLNTTYPSIEADSSTSRETLSIMNLDTLVPQQPNDIDSGSSKSSNEGEKISTSSSSSSFHDEIETTLLGSDNSKYMQLFLSYDQESSQAACDTLALLSTSSASNSVFNIHEENTKKLMPNKESCEFEKYIPKVPATSVTSRDETDLSTLDLKQAILATAKKKDEVEQRNRVLYAALEEQRDLSRTVQRDYDMLLKENGEKEESNMKKINDMSREIEVLKNQLKKYVAAVQLLRNDKVLTDEAKEAVGSLRLSDDIVVPPKPKERTLSENDSIFEDKLAQMAEMHGELLELQEVLQRQLITRDNQILRMKHELVSLRGPLPEEQQNNSLTGSSESLYTATRLLINIWIPSVFLKGKGTDAHHLYQIYIRIGDEEWNIYRRYSQFHKLFLQMCKSYPALEKFDFPKKKMFGKKDLKFVEARRRKLQDYLRTLINTLIANHTELTTNTEKRKLVHVLPFFGEQFGALEDKKKLKNTKKSSPQYTGL